MYDAYTNDNGINDKIKWKGNIKKEIQVNIQTEVEIKVKVEMDKLKVT